MRGGEGEPRPQGRARAACPTGHHRWCTRGGGERGREGPGGEGREERERAAGMGLGLRLSDEKRRRTRKIMDICLLNFRFNIIFLFSLVASSILFCIILV
jgi:hypothetical protein